MQRERMSRQNVELEFLLRIELLHRGMILFWSSQFLRVELLCTLQSVCKNSTYKFPFIQARCMGKFEEEKSLNVNTRQHEIDNP
jgi:hypothetical protein